MEKIEVFNNDKLGKVRIVMIENDIWFVLRDVMRVLGLNNVTDLTKRLNTKGLDKIELLTNGGKQQGWIINESNLYKCIMRSNKPEALEFENWVTEEVLPTIRKTGKYDINKPKQLSLPKPKEHKIIKKYYNGVPVMGTRDLASITGKSYATIHYYALKNKTLVHKHELVNFKKENPGLPSQISNITILYREEVINICKKMGVYNKVKPQILAYFDDFAQEPNIVSSEPQEVITDQNMKAEKLLQVLPHITEESLKSHVVTEVIRLIDNKILEEYENGKLHMRFVDSSEKILEVREQNGFRVTVVETNKPIEEFVSPDYSVTKLLGNKLIVEKIK